MSQGQGNMSLTDPDVAGDGMDSNNSVITPTKPKVARIQLYRKDWEQQTWAAGWLTQGRVSTKAYCLYCEKELAAGKSELIKHSESEKHIRLSKSDGGRHPASGLDGLEGLISLSQQAQTSNPNFTRYAVVNASTNSSSNGISRFPVPDVHSVPEDLREMMLENLEKAGFIPNVFQALAHRPAELRAFISYYEAVMNDRVGSNLTKADKEMIIVAVSAHNKCRYCIIAHGALFRIFSKHATLADQVAANWKTADLDQRQKAILEFALEVSQCNPLQDSHFATLYHHGLTQEDAWDIGSVVALFSLSNRMAFLTNMVPNDEFYMLGRVPRQPKS